MYFFKDFFINQQVKNFKKIPEQCARTQRNHKY